MANFILFDLDGTLIDGVDDILAAMNTLLADNALPPVDRHAIEAMLGDGTRMLTKRAFAARGQDVADDVLDALNVEFNRIYVANGYAHTRLYDDVAATLGALHDAGWVIGLASNKPTIPCRQILDQMGIAPLFSVIAGGDATHVKKPDGGHLHFALSQAGFAPDAGDFAIMVGDHANDVMAARDAGIAAIAVAFEVPDTRARSLGADAVLTRFSTLPGAIEKIMTKAA